jgi:hypothetical protein
MRQRRDDVLDHSIGKVVLFLITAHVGEWQNRDGGFVGKRQRLRIRKPGCLRWFGSDAHRVSADRLNVLQILHSQINEGQRQDFLDLFVCRAGNADAIRRRARL